MGVLQGLEDREIHVPSFMKSVPLDSFAVSMMTANSIFRQCFDNVVLGIGVTLTRINCPTHTRGVWIECFCSKRDSRMAVGSDIVVGLLGYYV